MSFRGIQSVGCYIPRLRLSRKAIAEANAWANPGLKAKGKGFRAICCHDEDSITMAVAAARSALADHNDTALDRLIFASTTLPFADRQNGALLVEALGIGPNVQTLDLSGSLKAGTGALLSALNQEGSTLVIAADNRRAKPASVQEMNYGAGANAFIAGSYSDDGALLAKLLGSHSVSVDLADHYRQTGENFDYAMEERWVKEEGYLKIIPDGINALLDRLGIAPGNIDHLAVAGPDPRTASAIAKRCEISADAVTDNLSANCGDTGVAQPLMMLAHTLENAQPNQRILVAGVGQGCDVLLFETTDNITALHARKPLQKTLDRGHEDNNYLRYLSFCGELKPDWGLRAERDNRVAQSAFYRHRKAVTGFIGGRCNSCGTPQFPKKPMCVNPECRSAEGMTDEPFKDKPAVVKSFTEDWLAVSANPPFIYGNVSFRGGGVVMMEFTDLEPGTLSVGTPLSMELRIKMEDDKRGYTSYFWKATPL